MPDKPTSLDAHRGMTAQKATDLRRLRVDVDADQAALRARQADLEGMLSDVPAVTWGEAVEKARYLLGLLADSPTAADPRRRKLIGQVLADFDHLLTSDRAG
jgi:FMN phosphatase YigB (HAD superfamily)